jgi:DNA end-binding protein Ku
MPKHRSIASLSLSFGLVSIPVKLYSATESTSAIRFKLMASGGARVRQQYVSDRTPNLDEEEAPDEAAAATQAAAARSGGGSRVVDFPAPRRPVAAAPSEPPRIESSFEPSIVERSALVKGYEFETGRFVLFTADELKALAEGSRQTIDIVSFIPAHSVDPVYYDKPYFLAPDKRGAKPYNLLLRAMRDTGRCALAKWAWRAKEYVVEIRAAAGGMVLQQLLYADEVRSIEDLDIDAAAVGHAELELAKRLIEQISTSSYDPHQFVDEEKKRILDAVDAKIVGRQVVAPAQVERQGGQVVDLVEALRASLQPPPAARAEPKRLKPAKSSLIERKPVKRAAGKRLQGPASSKERAGKS